MNVDNIVDLIIYVFCFIASMYALESINFEKFIKKNKVASAWLLYLLLAFSLAYLTAQFLFAINIFG